MFSPWEYNIDKAAERLLAAVGWNAPAGGEYPTGGELLVQYRERWHAHGLKDRIRTQAW